MGDILYQTLILRYIHRVYLTFIPCDPRQMWCNIINCVFSVLFREELDGWSFVIGVLGLLDCHTFVTVPWSVRSSGSGGSANRFDFFRTVEPPEPVRRTTTFWPNRGPGGDPDI